MCMQDVNSTLLPATRHACKSRLRTQWRLFAALRMTSPQSRPSRLASHHTMSDSEDFPTNDASADGQSEGQHGKARMPELICFDLDYTLWPLWVDTHVDPPIKRKGARDVNKVYDRNGSKMSFYQDVPAILLQLKEDPDITVALASRTHAPKAAEQALDQLLIPTTSEQTKQGTPLMRAIECFDTREIYPGSKITHFKKIHKSTGIPYEEMVFFDDESRNREVASLGVTFVLVPDGVNRPIFEKGLKDWRDTRAGTHSKIFTERKGKGKK